MKSEIVVVLSDEEKKCIESLIQRLPYLEIRNVSDEILTDVIMLGRKIPERIARLLIEFRRNPNRYGTLLFRNLPIDPILPSTPFDGGLATDKKSSYSEYCLLLFMQFLGEPISYEDEKQGLLVQNICPVKGKETKQENTSSSHFFKFHTENAIHPYKPDHLALLCLRADHDKKAKTLISSITNILTQLSSTTIALLRRPLYRLYAPSSFANQSNTRYSNVIPILTGNLLQPEMCVHFPTMEGINRDAQWALDKLQTVLLNNSEEFLLQSGDLLIIDNRITAHARNSFQARYDGNDRWLQRIFTVENLRCSSFSRGFQQHMCTPLFLEQLMHDSTEIYKDPN